MNRVEVDAIVPEMELLRLGKGLTFVKAETNISQNYAVLNLGVNEFITFCEDNGIRTIFYRYVYYEKAQYSITKDLLEEYTDNKREYEYCKKWADERNKSVENIDFQQPRALSMVATMDSMILILLQKNDWMDPDLLEATDALLKFQDDHEDELLELSDNNETEVDLMDELQSKLLGDPNFRFSTNKDSRRTYAREFFRKSENKKYLKIVKAERNTSMRMYKIELILDRIYGEYRNACYRAKVQVGEPLPKE